MHRASRLVILTALTAASVLPVSTAAAATAVTYKIAGTASAATFPQASFSGLAVSDSRTEVGVWRTVVSQDLGSIVGGTFTFRSKVHSLDDTVVGGTFGTGFGSPPGTCAKTTIPVHGLLGGGGSFDVTLTRYGSLRSGQCVVYLSTVHGTATLVFAS